MCQQSLRPCCADDLPIWGFVGKVEKLTEGDAIKLKSYLFTHVQFEILWNDDRVIEINVSTDPNQVHG